MAGRYERDGRVPVLEVNGQAECRSRARFDLVGRNHGSCSRRCAERFEALRWILFDNHKFTSNYACIDFRTH